MAPALLWGHADAGRPVSGHGVPLACGHDHDDLVDPVGHAGPPDFITDMITKMRDAGLSHMLCQRDGSSPYTAKAEGA